MLISKEVEVAITNRNRKHYRSLNYNCNIGDIIKVKVKDLTCGSIAQVDILCDICKINVVTRKYNTYTHQHKFNDLDCCTDIKCKAKKQSLSSRTQLEQIIQFIESQGYKFIETVGEYHGIKSSLILECFEGHQLKYEIQAFQNGRRCSKCKGTYQHSHTYKEVYEYFKSQGCLLLEDEYKTVHTLMKYKCLCDNISQIRFKDFLNGHRCRVCAGKKKYEYDEVYKIFENGGCTLLSTEYKSNKQKLEYICSCGNISKITLSDFMYGVRCRQCYLENNKGENHPCWNPNKSKDERILERRYQEYFDWRKSVFERDKYLCQICLDKQKNNLTAHHKDGYNWCVEKRTDIANGITLCKDCHNEFHQINGFGWNTFEQFNEFYNNKTNQSA